MADASDLKSATGRCEGSSPFLDTKFWQEKTERGGEVIWFGCHNETQEVSRTDCKVIVWQDFLKTTKGEWEALL